jgi:hypothetical protein
MLQNPLTDTIDALADTGFPKPAFWFLLLGGAVAATLVWRSEPSQRSIQDAGRCLLRVIVGTWWQQSLWKVPPHYDGGPDPLDAGNGRARLNPATERPRVTQYRDIRAAGLRDRGRDRRFADPWIAHACGCIARRRDGDQLWLGLYNAPGEWPWTYMFLVVIQLIYLIDPPGRSVGFDALLRRRRGTHPGGSTPLTLVA